MENEVIFRYKTQPSFGIRDGYGGFELVIYINGELEYTQYLFSNKVDSIYKSKVSEECIERITSLVNANKIVLSGVPKRLNNGTLDGSMVSIEFYRIHEIKGINLKEIDMEEVNSI